MTGAGACVGATVALGTAAVAWLTGEVAGDVDAVLAVGVGEGSRWVDRGEGAPPRTSPPGVEEASAADWVCRSSPVAPMVTLAARRMTANAPTAILAAPNAVMRPEASAPSGGSGAAPGSMAWSESNADAERMQSSHIDAWRAASRGGSPSAPAASHSANRSCGSIT